jgi:hypothetical protein
MARRSDNTIELIMVLGGGAFLAWKAWPAIQARFMPAGQRTATPAIQAPVSSATGSTGTQFPLGIRNNNPGNIKYNLLNQWQGQTGSNKGYATFSDPVYGYRAMFKLLKTYYNQYGLRDLLAIGKRWAPASENNPVAWSSNVALMSGIPQQKPFNVNDKATMIAIARGITGAENGSAFVNHYKTDVLEKAWALAQ